MKTALYRVARTKPASTLPRASGRDSAAKVDNLWRVAFLELGVDAIGFRCFAADRRGADRPRKPTASLRQWHPAARRTARCAARSRRHVRPQILQRIKPRSDRRPILDV